MRLAEWAFAQDDISPSVKTMLESHIERLRTGFVEVDKAFDKEGNIKRLSVILNGDRVVKKALDNPQ